MTRSLDRAHDELGLAREEAGDRMLEQLQSIDEGLFEEESGVRTRDDPEPKLDRVAELEKKLRALADEAESPAVREHVLEASDHLAAYRTEREDAQGPG